MRLEKYRMNAVVAELLLRMLALIDAMHRPEDLTPARVTQFTGLPMTREDRPDHDHYFEYREMTDMWQVRLSLGLEFMTKRPEMGFRFVVTEQYGGQRTPANDGGLSVRHGAIPR